MLCSVDFVDITLPHLCGVEGLEDVITGLGAGHSLAAEAVPHLAALSLDIVTIDIVTRYRH